MTRFYHHPNPLHQAAIERALLLRRQAMHTAISEWMRRLQCIVRLRRTPSTATQQA